MPLSRWELGPCLTQCGLGRSLLPYKVASSFIQLFGHNRHEPKIGEGALPPFWEGDNVVWNKAYLRTEWHLDPCSRLTAINMGRKFGGLPPLLGKGQRVPHLTQSPLG